MLPFLVEWKEETGILYEPGPVEVFGLENSILFSADRNTLDLWDVIGFAFVTYPYIWDTNLLSIILLETDWFLW